MSKRMLLANVLDKIGATGALLRVRRIASHSWLPVVTFHRVLDRAKQGPYLFDEGVVDASPAEFERHIRAISRFFTPIVSDDLIRALDGQRLPPNPILVTFDDGYKDNLEVALPILQRYGVRATFFIATHYLSARRMFWWDRINYVVKRSPQAKLRLSIPHDLELSIASDTERTRSIDTLLRIVKTQVGLDLEQFLDALALAARVPYNDRLDRELADAALMTWDEVRQMRRAGMDIQSHTRTHRVLQTLDLPQLHSELSGSRADLERELDAPITSISYPVGHRLDDDSIIRDALHVAGYKLGFTNATGTHRVAAGNDRYDVRRLACEVGTPDALFRARLAAPFLFG